MANLHCLPGVSVKSLTKESVPSNVRNKNIKRLRRIHNKMNRGFNLWFYPYLEDKQVELFRIDIDHYGNLIANGRFIVNKVEIFSADGRLGKYECITTPPSYSEKEYDDFRSEWNDYVDQYND